MRTVFHAVDILAMSFQEFERLDGLVLGLGIHHQRYNIPSLDKGVLVTV
jgi:hypothetical protein